MYKNINEVKEVAKEVTIQVSYADEGGKETRKMYSGLKNTITNEQILSLKRFFEQLTDDAVTEVIKITKEEVEEDG